MKERQKLHTYKLTQTPPKKDSEIKGKKLCTNNKYRCVCVLRKIYRNFDSKILECVVSVISGVMVVPYHNNMEHMVRCNTIISWIFVNFRGFFGIKQWAKSKNQWFLRSFVNLRRCSCTRSLSRGSATGIGYPMGRVLYSALTHSRVCKKYMYLSLYPRGQQL